ncbi:MAG: acetate--CoA ligase [Mycobacteriales bacterium]
MRSQPVLTHPRRGAPGYAELCEGFSWEAAAAGLTGPGGALNLATVALDRQLDAGLGATVALRCLDRTGAVTDVTYAELDERVRRFAGVLEGLGVGRGETVFALLGRVPELHVACLGTVRHGAVFAPLFAAFGPEPVLQRMRLGDARVLVTTRALYRRRLAGVRDQLPGLRHVLLVDGRDGLDGEDGVVDLPEAMAAAGTGHRTATTTAEDPALLHFTSGTTGTPKGAVHVHGAVVAHHVTAALALDLKQGDTYWCTADPGWVTGISYGVVAPLTHGVTAVLDAREFDARGWYRVLAEQGVTVWYTAPTALRMLMRRGAELAREHDLSALRHIASVGEPLNPEVVTWGQEALGLPVHDNWWQTETGAIMISNYPGMDIRPGSMGRPVPGVEAAVLVRGEDGRALVTDGRVRRAPAGEPGELALRAGWPSMFRGYLGQPERYARCFADGWYLTGDLASQDEDGYLWFVGRADDVIKSAGHLIGPFEVESTLMEHAAVAEVGVIGKPDPVAGEVVKAFVTLRPGYACDEQMRLDLLAFGRSRLGGLGPKEIAFDDHLPHTSSGKVMRRLLKARELGLPEGDLSTLETS